MKKKEDHRNLFYRDRTALANAMKTHQLKNTESKHRDDSDASDLHRPEDREFESEDLFEEEQPRSAYFLTQPVKDNPKMGQEQEPVRSKESRDMPTKMTGDLPASNDKSAEKILRLEHALQDEIMLREGILVENMALKEHLNQLGFTPKQVRDVQYVKVGEEIRGPSSSPDRELMNRLKRESREKEALADRVVELEEQLNEMRLINEECQENLDFAVKSVKEAQAIKEEFNSLVQENKSLKEKLARQMGANNSEKNASVTALDEQTLRNNFKEAINELKAEYEEIIANLTEKNERLEKQGMANTSLVSDRSQVFKNESEFFKSQELMANNAQLQLQVDQLTKQKMQSFNLQKTLESLQKENEQLRSQTQTQTEEISQLKRDSDQKYIFFNEDHFHHLEKYLSKRNLG